MKNPWIIPAATLVFGAVGGFISGKSTSSPGDKASAAVEASQRTRSVDRNAAASEDERRAGSRPRDAADAMNTPGHSARIKGLLDYYGSLTTEQLADEAKKLENLPMSERIMASFLLFGRWAEVDPTSAMAHANSMGFAAGFVRPTILNSWASVDPENAARYYSENPREFSMMGGPGGGGQSGASMIAAEWAKQDPQAAMAWASSLSGEDQVRAMTSVVREMAAKDPKKAAEMVSSIDPSERGNAYQAIALSYGAQNFSEAETWVRGLPSEEQGPAMAAALEGLSKTDPQGAWEKAKGMPDGEDKDRAMRNVLENMAKQDSAKALAELASLSEQQQRRSIGSVIQNVAANNSAAAWKYVESLSPGPVRDRGVSEIIVVDRRSEPSSLFSLAETITDDRDRARSMGIAAARWMREDETEARLSIQQSTAISDEMKQRLLDGRRFSGGAGGPRGGGQRGPRSR